MWSDTAVLPFKFMKCRGNTRNYLMFISFIESFFLVLRENKRAIKRPHFT